MILQAYINAMKNLPADISQAEAHLEMQTQKSVSVKNGTARETKSFEKYGVYVRATGKNTGICYTENLNEDPLSVMNRAVQNASIISKVSEISLTHPGLTYPDCPPGVQITPTIEGLISHAVRLEKEALAVCQDSQLAECNLAFTCYTEEVVNSLNLAVSSRSGFYTLTMHIVSRIDGVMGEKQTTLLAEDPEEFMVQAAVERALESTRHLASPSPVSSGNYDILISRDAGFDFLFMLWRSMSAVQNRQTGCAFSEKIGKRIGEKCLSIVSASAHPDCPIRYTFDNEGMPVAQTRLVDRGLFTSLMHNRSTARDAGIHSTGNAGRRITIAGVVQIPLLVTPKVLFIESGTTSQEKMLAELADGLIIESILDSFHGIDYSSGEFSVPVMCLIVKNGKICGASQALVWAGNLVDVLGNVQSVGNKMSFSCFRDSFTFGTPDLLVRNQTLASAG